MRSNQSKAEEGTENALLQHLVQEGRGNMAITAQACCNEIWGGETKRRRCDVVWRKKKWETSLPSLGEGDIFYTMKKVDNLIRERWGLVVSLRIWGKTSQSSGSKSMQSEEDVISPMKGRKKKGKRFYVHLQEKGEKGHLPTDGEKLKKKGKLVSASSEEKSAAILKEETSYTKHPRSGGEIGKGDYKGVGVLKRH